MHVKSTLRWFAGLGVAGAWIAATAIPASAAAATPSVYLDDATIAVGGPGTVHPVTVAASGPLVVHEPTVTFDATDLAGIVDISAEEWRFECTSPSANVVVCAIPDDVSLDEDADTGLSTVVLKAASGAKSGDSGTIKVTFEGRGLAPVTHEAAVRVGDAVDLAAGPDIKLSAAPGEAFTVTLRVGNVGENVAEGATVFFENDEELHPGKRYSNCLYSGDDLRSCTFDSDLRPGATYQGEFAFLLDPGSVAPSEEFASARWITNAAFEDYLSTLEDRGVSPGEPGTDGEIALTEVASLKARGAQADVDPGNNYTGMDITVTGQHGADLAAVGDAASGAAGQTVTVEVGVANNGPADVDNGDSAEAVTSVRVAIPTGTTAVGVPEACYPVKDGDIDSHNRGEAGARGYFCLPATFLAAGKAHLMEFELRIDEVVADATGTVTINGDDFPTFEPDLDTSNDTAKIVINGSGGGLPVTGASTGVAAAVGGLLVVVGVAGFLIARRRRLRFTA